MGPLMPRFFRCLKPQKTFLVLVFMFWAREFNRLAMSSSLGYVAAPDADQGEQLGRPALVELHICHRMVRGGRQLAVGKCWENGFEVRLRCGWGTVESVIYVWVSVEYALSIRWVPVKPQLSVGWAYAEPQLRFVFFFELRLSFFYGLRSGWGKSAYSKLPQSIVFMVWVGFEWILSRIWVDFEWILSGFEWILSGFWVNIATQILFKLTSTVAPGPQTPPPYAPMNLDLIFIYRDSFSSDSFFLFFGCSHDCCCICP